MVVKEFTYVFKEILGPPTKRGWNFGLICSRVQPQKTRRDKEKTKWDDTNR